MEELDREYTILFNGITDTIKELEKAISRLKYLQQAAEEEYLAARSGGGPPPEEIAGLALEDEDLPLVD